MTFVVEAEPIDDSAIVWRAENARSRVSALLAWRQRADLDEAETRGEQRAWHTCVFVKARRHDDRVWEAEPPDRLCQTRVVAACPRIDAKLETTYGKIVRTLGIEGLQ